jgi:hypothetical protein
MTPLPKWGMMHLMVASRTLALAVWGWSGRPHSGVDSRERRSTYLWG